jgi:TPR repeat protein
MTFNSNTGAERPSPSPRTGSPVAAAPGAPGIRDEAPGQHSPEAEGMLRRFLSEVHGYRQLGNAALRELESRLQALSAESETWETSPGARTATSKLMRPSVPRTAPPQEKSPALNDRLRELSTYLHADLTQQQHETPEPAPAERALPPRDGAAMPPAANTDGTAARQGVPKTTPTAPVLDRLWFEERFAQMRASIDQLAEKIPSARLDALEFQFHALMEKLGTRESDRSMAPVEAGLKKLATYLEDNRHWTVAQDARVQGVEDRIAQLSGLVAQSHAAISATAKGLEIVARGTGAELARTTADLVAGKLEEKLERLNPNGAITELSRDVATLSAQSTQLALSTEERLRQLQLCLDESIDRLNDEVHHTAQKRPAGSFDAETYADEDYDSNLTAAHRAARLAGGPARAMPQQGEPVRYQIPYGEFLPDEERRHSRTGLVVAAIILVLASAAMLYLNLRDRRAPDAPPKAGVSDIAPKRDALAPVTTASLPAAKTAERISLSPPAAVALSNEVWVTSVIAEETTARAPGRLAAGGMASKDLAPEGARPSLRSGGNSGDSLRKAAVEGDVDAQFSIGEDYLEGNGGEQLLPVGERLSKAARWFRRAAENGHAASAYRLATLYELGQGAPKDSAQSMVWYERAAQKGHVKAMHNLAVLSIAGGKSANYLTAAKWFAKAAEHGLRDSQYNLGILYEHGLGVAKNPAEAYKWFAIAADGGDAKAARRRDGTARALTEAERGAADRALASWAMSPVDEAVNRAAPEPPLDEERKAEAAIQPKPPSAQLMKTAWRTQIAQRDMRVAEAQRLLAELGYKPGPADGTIGPRTLAAIREFEKRSGLRPTGQLSEALLARMAFAQI